MRTILYVTGDFHGIKERFLSPEVKRLKKEDTLIICGDFGFLWSGTHKEQRLLKWIGRRRYNTLFLDGCHENYALLEQIEPVPFAGGMARKISGRLYHLMRGEIYGLEGRRVFTFGGGESPDREIRKPGETWFPQELPTQAQMNAALENLALQNNRVDYILTHEPPGNMSRFVNMDASNPSAAGLFFDRLVEKAAFTKWFFGYCHLDKPITAQFQAVFEQVVPLK